MIRDIIALILDIEQAIGIMGMWGLTALVSALWMASHRINLHRRVR